MKRLLKPIIFVVVGLAVGAGGMFGASRVLGFGGSADQEQAAPSGKHGKADHPTGKPGKNQPPPVGVLYVTKERVVNLADPGVLRYIKIVVALEIEAPALKGKTPKGEELKKAQEELAKEMKPVAPLIDDQITNVVSAKTVNQVTTVEGKQRLKEELLDKLNHALHEHNVLNVYFSEFVIQ